MLIPNDKQCRDVLDELEDCEELTAWQRDFLESNKERMNFTLAQKEVIADLCNQYDVDAFRA